MWCWRVWQGLFGVITLYARLTRTPLVHVSLVINQGVDFFAWWGVAGRACAVGLWRQYGLRDLVPQRKNFYVVLRGKRIGLFYRYGHC